MRDLQAKPSVEYMAVVFAAVVPSGAVVLLHAYLGGYTRMIADDFCSAYFAGHLGLLRSIWYWYINWSGRFAAFGADWLVEKISVSTLPAIHSLTVIAWLVFAVVGLQISLKHILPQAKSISVSLALGTVFLFVVLLLNPSIQQTVYWWNGMRSYLLPLVLLTLYGVLLQVGVEKWTTSKWQTTGVVISFLFMLMTGGLGETYVAFQVVLLFYLLALELLVHRDKSSLLFRLLLAGWIGSLAAFAIVVVAPGNAVRQAYFPPHPSLVKLFQISFQSYLDFIFDILRSPEKIAGLFGAILTAAYFGTLSERKSNVERWFIPALLFGSFALSFACFVPGAYATSEATAERTIVIPVFGLVLFLLWAGFLFGQQLSRNSLLVGRIIPVLAVIMISYSAVLGFQNVYNTRRIYMDFAQKWDKVDAQILLAKNSGAESVTVPALNVPSGPGGDPIDNPNYWVNQCYSLYYGIQVLGPSPDAQP
jgi:hypothetical protein